MTPHRELFGGLKRISSMTNPTPPAIVTSVIRDKIYTIRGLRVMLDSHLAELYGVLPIRLRQQVKRNIARFPKDFMFALTENEAKQLVSENAIPSGRHRGGHLPLVFTQEGVAMLSSILRSPRAVQVNIAIMRAFVQLREAALHHLELTRKLAELESRVGGHDTQIQEIFDALRNLMAPLIPEKPAIGFNLKKKVD